MARRVRDPSRRLFGVTALSLLSLLAACRTAPTLPPADLDQPGWRLDHGQAVWRPPSASADLAGELTCAAHPDGSAVLEFTKTPLTLVIARVTPELWQLNLLAENRVYSGRGDPPSRSAWLVLAAVMADRSLPDGWEWSAPGPGQWRLENPRTGELLRGYWHP
jgi:hypothetical protein